MQEKPEPKDQPMTIDNKFVIALKAIHTAQHEVKAGHEINLAHILEDARKQVTS